jgi:hypothetical protein
METIKQVLMRRDKMSAEEADDIITEATREVQRCADNNDLQGAEDVISDYFGLEPDFLMELL